MYYQHYTSEFMNRLSQYIRIEFWQNEVFSDSYSILECREFKHDYINGDEDKFNPCIIHSKVTIKIAAKAGSNAAINNEMFYANAYDHWKIIIYADEQIVFQGFVTSDVEPYVLKDKPYEIVIVATDGLSLTQGVELSDVNGVPFDGRNTIISYIAGALKKTNLDLDIVSTINIYNAGQNDRFDLGAPDCLTQTKIHHRTFLQDVNAFYDCHETLERILKSFGCILFQWNGKWVISDRSELLNNSGPQIYSSTYSSLGALTLANQNSETPPTIGKNLKVSPVKLNQLVSYLPPVKSVKTSYEYTIPENLINNEKLNQLGDLIPGLSGSGFNAYELVGWSQFQDDIRNNAAYGGTRNAYIKTEFNIYNVETDRYYVIEADTGIADTMGHHIKHDNLDFWVKAGSLLDVSATSRVKNSVSSVTLSYVRIALFIGGSMATSTNWWTLQPGGTWLNNHLAVFHQLNTATNIETDWNTTSVTDVVIPADGYIYVVFGSGQAGASNEAHHQPIKLSYRPFINGSLSSVKGDYWFTSQDTNIKDVIEDEAFLSDSTQKIFKGALFDLADNLTNPDWYRLNVSENRHFKELVNLSRYRHQYRRQRKISGEFKGTKYSPGNNAAIEYPLAFHKHMKFQNDPAAVATDYVLVPPLSIDWIQGIWQGTLMDTLKSGSDVTQLGDTHEFKHKF